MEASAPININNLQKELAHHPDRGFVDSLIQGLRHGFDTGLQTLPLDSLICRNLRSATSQPKIVTELINAELSKGYIIGPFSNPPFDIYRINPIGMVQKKYSKKYRLIVDLSAPHNDPEHPSLNNLIDQERRTRR